MAYGMGQKTAVIIGAGPAGLTAAFELLARTDIKPVVLEKSDYMGGIARTVNYKGNRIDIGGHRFFSKSDRVMEWWLDMLPLQDADDDRVMLLRRRTSPDLLPAALLRLSHPAHSRARSPSSALTRTFRIGVSYLCSVLFPIKRRSARWSSSSSTASAGSCTRRSSRTTPRRSGACPATRSARSGARSGSRACRSPSRSSTSSGKLFRPSGPTSRRRARRPRSSSGSSTPSTGPGQMWEEVARRVAEKGGEVLTGLGGQRDPRFGRHA